jgi:hypothetical protein
VDFKLSKTNQILKTEVLARAREKHVLLCTQIDSFNVVIRSARASVDIALRDYTAAAVELRRFAETMAGEQARVFDSKSERWKRTLRAELARDWIDRYSGFQPVAPELQLPLEIEYPDDDLLSDFEELPDAP